MPRRPCRAAPSRRRELRIRKRGQPLCHTENAQDRDQGARRKRGDDKTSAEPGTRSNVSAAAQTRAGGIGRQDQFDHRGPTNPATAQHESLKPRRPEMPFVIFSVRHGLSTAAKSRLSEAMLEAQVADGYHRANRFPAFSRSARMISWVDRPCFRKYASDRTDRYTRSSSPAGSRRKPPPPLRTERSACWSGPCASGHSARLPRGGADLPRFPAAPIRRAPTADA